MSLNCLQVSFTRASLDERTTLAFSFANHNAISLPIPLPDPIIITDFHSNQEELINFLSTHQTSKMFSYSFAWSKGDIAVWSNRCMLHAATAFNGDRKMFRITIQ